MINGMSVAVCGSERLSMTTPPVVLGTRLLQCGRTLWLELQGVLNWCTTDMFRLHVGEGLGRPCRRVIADLTRLDYVGGNGLHALMRLQDQLASKNVELLLVVPEGSPCARTLALARLNGVLHTFANPARAWRHRGAQSVEPSFAARGCDHETGVA
jgi:anti-anti-sigma regulatory factor